MLALTAKESIKFYNIEFVSDWIKYLRRKCMHEEPNLLFSRTWPLYNKRSHSGTGSRPEFTCFVMLEAEIWPSRAVLIVG